MKRKTYHPILIDSIEATADIPAHVLVGYDGSIASEGARALGVSINDTAAGEMCGVGVIGIYLVTAGGAITAGDLVATGADGKVITATGGIAIGVAREAATAEGELITVVLGASTAGA